MARIFESEMHLEQAADIDPEQELAEAQAHGFETAEEFYEAMLEAYEDSIEDMNSGSAFGCDHASCISLGEHHPFCEFVKQREAVITEFKELLWEMVDLHKRRGVVLTAHVYALHDLAEKL